MDQLVNQSFRDPIRVSFRKLHGYIAESRASIPSDTMDEWFEWLVDRMSELETRDGRIPAHRAHADWRP